MGSSHARNSWMQQGNNLKFSPSINDSKVMLIIKIIKQNNEQQWR